jgi:hypothetical protein
VKQEFLRFLDAGGCRARNDQFDVRRAFGESTITTQHSDRDHAAAARFLDGGEHVARFAGTGDADEHIARLPESVDLAGERIGEIVVVADGREQAAIHAQSHGGVRAPVADEAADEFGRDVRGIGGAAAVSAKDEFAAGNEGLGHRAGRTIERFLQRTERIERLPRRGERALIMRGFGRIHGRAGTGQCNLREHFEPGTSDASQIPFRAPFDIRGQTFFDARMQLRNGLFVAALLLASCAAPPKPVALVDAPVLSLALDNDFEFRKVKRFLNQPELFQPTENEMINFDRRRVNFGALSAEERRQRQGTYFDFFWRANRPADLKVRFEYRQARLGNAVRAQEVAYEQAKGTVKTSFAVVGDSYHWAGPVNAWRCLLIENNRIVAFTQSYLWK